MPLKSPLRGGSIPPICEHIGLMNPATIYQAVNTSPQNTLTLIDLRELAAKGDALLFEDFSNYYGGVNLSSQLFGDCRFFSYSPAIRIARRGI